MISRHDLWHAFPVRPVFYLFCAALLTASLVFQSGIPSVCHAAEPPKVEQAGDRFVHFVLDEIEKARKKLPAIAAAADLAADRVVGKDGQLLSAGDRSFSLEPVWRAGGIAFSRQYLPDKQAATAAVKAADDKIPYYRTKECVEHFTVQ
jgi:hypothetical protein